MPTERSQRHIDRLLDEADKAMAQRDWPLLRQHAQDVLLLDADNKDAQELLTAAERALSAAAKPKQPADVPLAGAGGSPALEGEAVGSGELAVVPATPTTAYLPASGASALPTAFDAGRYTVKRFLGEGGKKKVYLAHDKMLDRDVAFALIKTEGLDDIGRERVSREGQAMGRLGSHPHIVTVFDLGEEPVLPLRVGEGRGEVTQPFIVTELMGGGDVEGLIEKARDHKLPLEQALRIAEQSRSARAWTMRTARTSSIATSSPATSGSRRQSAVGNRQSGTGWGPRPTTHG